jgi:putative photosynthetic complex assembly protein
MSVSAQQDQGLVERLLPRAPWLIAGFLTLAVLGVVVPLPHVGPAPAAAPAEAPPQTRTLRFEDRADGAVLVRDARTEAPIAVFDIGQGGFVRGALRALVRGRRLEELGPTVPFVLTAWPDGRMTLADPATGNRIDLVAFGPTQRETFGRFLEPAASAR